VITVYRGVDGELVGTNSDVDGVAEALTGLDLEGQEVAVIGAGGAARAAFAVLAERKCAAVHVLARNPEKAVKVADSCGVFGVGVALAADSAALYESMLLINATQLGMTGQERMPTFVLNELNELAEGALVFDMVYAPLETDLLAAARRKGLRTSDGLVMLVGQAAVAFGKFFGQPAPREHDAELRALLTA
ncbi:MAG: shikimate dehydrogenase, partial [Novosphingobium sp.]